MPTRPSQQSHFLAAFATALLALCLTSQAPAQPTTQPLTVQVEGRARIATQSTLDSPLTVTVTNTTNEPLETGIACDAPPGWRAQPPTARVVLAPGEEFVWALTLTAPALVEQPASPPEVLIRVRAVPAAARGPDRLAAAITRRIPVPVDAVLPRASTAPSTNAFLRLSGRSALHIDLDRWTDRGPFTLEARVRATTPKGRAAVASNTEGSGFGLFWSDTPGSASLPAGYLHAGTDFARAEANQPWDWARWTHLALVYDGRSLAFFVNGRLTERTPVAAEPNHNDLPLIVGADVDARARPVSFWSGDLDDVRLSSVARYGADFTPPDAHGADADTVVLLNFDQQPAPVIRNLAQPNPNAGGHAWIIGSPEIIIHAEK